MILTTCLVVLLVLAIFCERSDAGFFARLADYQTQHGSIDPDVFRVLPPSNKETVQEIIDFLAGGRESNSKRTLNIKNTVKCISKSAKGLVKVAADMIPFETQEDLVHKRTFKRICHHLRSKANENYEETCSADIENYPLTKLSEEFTVMDKTTDSSLGTLGTALHECILFLKVHEDDRSLAFPLYIAEKSLKIEQRKRPVTMTTLSEFDHYKKKFYFLFMNYDDVRQTATDVNKRKRKKEMNKDTKQYVLVETVILETESTKSQQQTHIKIGDQNYIEFPQKMTCHENPETIFGIPAGYVNKAS